MNSIKQMNRKKLLALITVIILTASIFIALIPLASAAPALTGVTVNATNQIAGATSTYTINFTTTTIGTIGYYYFEFPTGFNVASASVAISGTAGTTTILGQIARFTVTSPVSVPANSTRTATISGVVNPGATSSNVIAVSTATVIPDIIDGPTNTPSFGIFVTGITLTPTHGFTGSQVTITGVGFTANVTVTLTANSNPVGSLTTNSTG